MPDYVVPYEPREPQWALHEAIEEGLKHVLLVWHRRAGKTTATVNQLLRSASLCKKPLPRFAHISPLRNQGKRNAWEGIAGLKYFGQYYGGVEHESDLRMDLPNGAAIYIVGADNPDALRGTYLDGVVLDEYGQIPPTLRSEILLPALSDRDGWEIVAGTPKGRNQFYTLYAGGDEWHGALHDPSWRVLLRKASDTGLVSKVHLEELQREMSRDMFQQELECDWLAAAAGTYYARLMLEAEEQGRIREVPHDRGLKVDTAWDLGIGDATSIWFFQSLGPEVRAIDYYEADGEALAHYLGVLQQKARDHGYVYGAHLVPHDAGHRSIQTGKTLVDMARPFGFPMTVVPLGDFEVGIESCRQLIPRTWFDATRTKRGREALMAYSRKFNTKLNEYMDGHQHDWSSHGADAFRTYATDRVGRPMMHPSMAGRARPRFARM